MSHDMWETTPLKHAMTFGLILEHLDFPRKYDIFATAAAATMWCTTMFGYCDTSYCDRNVMKTTLNAYQKYCGGDNDVYLRHWNFPEISNVSKSVQKSWHVLEG